MQPLATGAYPMDHPAPAVPSFDDLKMLKVAREVASDLRPLPQILKDYDITTEQWCDLVTNPIFTKYLRQATEEWGAVTNTADRIQVKSLMLVEESLPEFYARMHDDKESLASKTDVFKTMARLAGIGNGGGDAGSIGEKFSVTINLGDDKKLKIERDITPAIDGDAQ
jgi:hypothetical protein